MIAVRTVLGSVQYSVTFKRQKLNRRHILAMSFRGSRNLSVLGLMPTGYGGQ